MGFSRSTRKAKSKPIWKFTNKESEEMANASISLKQAKDLVEDGLMSKKAFGTMIDDGRLEIFKFRSQSNKPEIVQTVHEQITAIIKENALELFKAGYRPSVIWNSLEEKTTEDTASSNETKG